jgi:hypothetical protein
MKWKAAGVPNALLVCETMSEEEIFWNALDPLFVENPVSLKFAIVREDPSVSIGISLALEFPAVHFRNGPYKRKKLPQIECHDR